MYAGQDDFVDIAALMERLSPTRPKDPRLEYAARRGLEYAFGDYPKSEHISQASRPTDLQNERGHSSVQHLEVAEPELMRGFGADETDVKVGAAELRRPMSQAAWEITMDRASLSKAGRALPARGLSGLVRRIERKPARSRDRDFEMEP